MTARTRKAIIAFLQPELGRAQRSFAKELAKSARAMVAAARRKRK